MLTSASTSVTVPLGRAAPHHRCSLETKAAAEASRRAGSVARFARTIRSSAGIRSRSIAPQLGAPPDGASPVSSARAVAANEYTSDAAVGLAPAATSGAT